MKESATTSHVRLDAAQLGIDLWRNNSGAWKDDTGRVIWYGLGSFTKRDKYKSSDYIGIVPTVITPDMVGKTLGVFVAVEMKAEDWKFYQSDEIALKQKNFHDIVKKAGGYAGFARNILDFRRIIGREK